MTVPAARALVFVALATAVAGSAAIVLPFTFSTSPLTALSSGESSIWMVAAPFWSMLVLLHVSVRLLRVGSLSLVEHRVAMILSIAMLVDTLAFVVRALTGSGNDWMTDPKQWGALLAPVLLAIAALVLVRRLRGRASLGVVTVCAIVGGYLPNAALCLIAFAGDWQIGAWVSLAAAIGAGVTVWLAARG